MNLSIVAAMAENRVIGCANELPWEMPADMKKFRELTAGNPIIMGRKTFESIGKVLPGRKNIVVSRKAGLIIDGCDVASSMEEALEFVAQEMAEEACVIGGEQIYKLALPKADRIYLTIIHADIEGDAYFPEIPEKKWQIVSEVRHEADEENPYPYTFLTYDRV